MNSQFLKITRNLILAEKRLQEVRLPRIQGLPQVPDLSSLRQPSLTKIQIQPLKLQPQLQVQHVDLGKLNEFLDNPEVRAIECDGAGKNILVKKQQLIETNIQLNEGEIMDLLNKFSKTVGIPLTPLFRASSGNLTLNAFISSTLGPKFLIIKR